MRQSKAQSAIQILDPAAIDKFVTSLFRLPTMPRKSVLYDRGGPVDYYEVGIRQTTQQILPKNFPKSTVWAYGSPGAGGGFHTPSFSFEAQWKRPVRVKWMNQLVNSSGAYLPPLFRVDQTLHWANPGKTDPSAQPYLGPVPDVTHLHGAHADEESDGYPEMWFLPNAYNLPSGFSKVGPAYAYFAEKFRQKYGVRWEPGTAVSQYRNDQEATALWFHAHTLGITRLNMYAGLAGMYFLRGGPSDQVGGVLPGSKDPNFEIPLVIQDRMFTTDGSSFYPDNRAFFDGFTGPYAPYDKNNPSTTSDIAPSWNPEVFGNMMVVNGNTWPYLEVEQRRYRFRMLNASNARTLLLQLSNGMPLWQIGADGGFLTQPVGLDTVTLAPSERADVIIDFSRIKTGTTVRLVNIGPDSPYGGGIPGNDFPQADPASTGLVMEFRIACAARSRDVSTLPDRLKLPPPPDLGPVNFVRQVSFNELETAVGTIDKNTGFPAGPRVGLLGKVDLSIPGQPGGVPIGWHDQITETPVVNSTEIWEIYDFTEDAHPFHLHQVEFEVLNRQAFPNPDGSPGAIRPPQPWETGRKDTVLIFPGEITRVKAHFDIVGLYVWHCHMVEHEDNEMMRPCEVVSG